LARILLATYGSYGDVHPYMALGVELRARGHSVTIAGAASYEAKVLSEGLDFHAVRPDADLEDRAMLGYIYDRRRGAQRLIGYLAGQVRESYEDTLAAARQADLIVTHPITYGAVLAAQKLGMPWASSVLAPILFLSADDPPVTAEAPWLARRRHSPRVMRWIWRAGKRRTRFSTARTRRRWCWHCFRGGWRGRSRTGPRTP
jgi:UDP:flavonoid glycosyltransferase YjiC (YdhE family)